MKFGSTRLRAPTAVSAASIAPVPSALNSAIRPRSVAARSDAPTTPFVAIMKAAKTVSRAKESLSPLTVSVTIRPTSMMVTATASSSEPKGSPSL